MESIYPHKRNAEKVIQAITNHPDISDRNKELIMNFKEECLAQGIGLLRITKCMHALKNTSLWLGMDFDKCKVDDLKKLIAKIEMMDNYSPRTKVDYRGVIKKFFKWLSNIGFIVDYSWIKTSYKISNEKLPSELLNEDDLIKMINSTKNPRDRAMISSLYESGCRIGEFLKIQLKDLIFEKPGCVFIVNGKTGGRRIRVISSEPYMVDWFNKHPDKENPEAFLWISGNTNRMLEYPAFCKVLRVIAKRAGVNKKVNPHNFRHTRATYLASRFTEQQLKVFFGWTRGSDMASVYVHLSGKDVDDALLNVYGIKKENQDGKISKLKPAVCEMCKSQNEPTNKFCKLCGMILDEDKRIEMQAREINKEQINDVMNLLMKDKDVLAIMAKKIKEIKS